MRDDPRVQAATRARIKAIAEDLHYYPNTLARAVFSGHTDTIGVLIPLISNPYWAQVLEGILTEAYRASYHVLVREITFHADDVQLAMASFIEQRVDGVICAPVYYEPAFAGPLLELKCHAIPVVGVDTLPGNPALDRVVTDWQQLAEVAVHYLLKLGHRHAALVGDMPNVPERLTMGYAMMQMLQRRHLSVIHLGKRPSETFDAAFAREALQEALTRRRRRRH